MRSSFIISSAILSSALGLVAPHAENTNLAKRFDVPDASVEEGFIVPEDTPVGLYRVSIDSDGVAHHVQVETSEQIEQLMSEIIADNDHDDDSNLEKRQSFSVSCRFGNRLNHEGADVTVRAMKASCGSGRTVPAGEHYYAVYNNVVTYFCNNSGSGYRCTESLISQLIQGRVAGACGDYIEGWAYTAGPGPIRTGSEIRKANNYFCGANHNP
jgi:hypothetical protein